MLLYQKNESLLALTVPEQRFASVWGLPMSKHCVCCRRQFSHQFCSPAVHATQGTRQSSCFTHIYDVPFWRPHRSILWSPFTQPILPGNSSSPVCTARWMSSAPVPWTCASAGKLCDSVICHSSPIKGSGNITTTRESGQGPSDNLYFTPRPGTFSEETYNSSWLVGIQCRRR